MIDLNNVPPCPCCDNEVIVKQKKEVWGNFVISNWVVICTGCSCGASNTSLEALLEDWSKRPEGGKNVLLAN